MFRSNGAPRPRWLRRWDKLTGKHTHSALLDGAFPEHWPYVRQLEIVPPFARCESAQLMRHPTTGVYWGMYAEDDHGVYEPLPESYVADIIDQKDLLQIRKVLFFKSRKFIPNLQDISQLEFVPPFTESDYNQLMRHRITGDYWAGYYNNISVDYCFVHEADVFENTNHRDFVEIYGSAQKKYRSSYRLWWRKFDEWIGKHTHWKILNNVLSEDRWYIKNLEIVPPFTEGELNQVLRHPKTGMYWAMYGEEVFTKTAQYRQYEPIPKAHATRLVYQKELIEARRIAFRVGPQYLPQKNNHYLRWQRRWNKLTGKHTHSTVIYGALRVNWPYISQLETVLPSARCEYSQLMRHPTTGVYWAMYAEYQSGIYEPLSKSVAIKIINRKDALKHRRFLFYSFRRLIYRHGLVHSSDPENWCFINQLEIVPLFTKSELNQLKRHPRTGAYWIMYNEDKYDKYELVSEADAIDIINHNHLIGAHRLALSRLCGTTYRLRRRKFYKWIGKHTHERLLHNIKSGERWYINQLETVPPFVKDERNQVLRHPETGFYWALYSAYYNDPSYKASQYLLYEPIPKSCATRMINRKKLINARRIALEKSKIEYDDSPIYIWGHR